MEKQEQQSPAEQQQPKQQVKQGKRKRKRRNRSIGEKILFFSFKWVFILFCLFVAVIAGLVVGFSIIGDGKASEVFDLRMWKHLYDLVFKI